MQIESFLFQVAHSHLVIFVMTYLNSEVHSLACREVAVDVRILQLEGHLELALLLCVYERLQRALHNDVAAGQ